MQPSLQTGDVVTPDIVVTDPWLVGKSAIVNVRFTVVSEGKTYTRFLTFEEVPYELQPYIDMHFYAGNTLISSHKDVKLVRDC